MFRMTKSITENKIKMLWFTAGGMCAHFLLYFYLHFSMGNLALCMPYNAQTAAIELVGCSMALDGVKSGVFSEEVGDQCMNRSF